MDLGSRRNHFTVRLRLRIHAVVSRLAGSAVRHEPRDPQLQTPMQRFQPQGSLRAYPGLPLSCLSAAA
jgi:hypothetical protein